MKKTAKKARPCNFNSPYLDKTDVRHEHFQHFRAAMSDIWQDLAESIGSDEERQGAFSILIAVGMLMDVALDTCSGNPAHVPIIRKHLRDLEAIDRRRVEKRRAA